MEETDTLKSYILEAMNHGKWEKNTGLSLLGNVGTATLQYGARELARQIYLLTLLHAQQQRDSCLAGIAMNLATLSLQDAHTFLKMAIEAPLPTPDDSFPLEVKERVEKENIRRRTEWSEMVETISKLSCFTE